MTNPPVNLTEAFAKTDTLVWGDFKMEKRLGQPLKNASFSVQNQVINLTPNEKRFISLLIAYQGHAVPADIFKEEFNIKVNFNPKNPAQRKTPLENNMAAYASKLRGKIRKVFGDEYADMIRPANPYRKLGETGQWNKEIMASYKLLPQPSVPGPY